MSDITSILLSDARESLIARVSTYCTSQTRLLERSLCFWLEIDALVGETVSLDDFFEMVMQTPSSQENRRIAALGLGVATYRLRDMALVGGIQKMFAEQLKWQIGCSARMNGQLQPFCLDSLALFGLAVGAVHLDEEIKQNVAGWLNEFLSESFNRRNIALWEQTSLAAISQILPMEKALTSPPDAICADCRLVLKRRLGLWKFSQKDDARVLLEQVKGADSNAIPLVSAAMRLSALEVINREAPVSSPNQWTTEDVSGLLRRFPRALERWTWEDKPMTSRQGAEARQWHIDHEYHVQNLLWGVLAPIFPDLEEEFYTESVGQKHPRADIGIPSLHLIIEAKFLRATDKPQKIIDEIAADASLYRATGSKWQHVIAFIWDEGRRSEAHETIRQGLAKIEGISDTIIISRPGKMVDSPIIPSTVSISTASTPPSASPSATNTPTTSSPLSPQ